MAEKKRAAIGRYLLCEGACAFSYSSVGSRGSFFHVSFFHFFGSSLLFVLAGCAPWCNWVDGECCIVSVSLFFHRIVYPLNFAFDSSNSRRCFLEALFFVQVVPMLNMYKFQTLSCVPWKWSYSYSVLSTCGLFSPPNYFLFVSGANFKRSFCTQTKALDFFVNPCPSNWVGKHA